MSLLDSIVNKIMPGHKCSNYEPKKPKVSDTYTCCCGALYLYVYRFPFNKWKLVRTSSGGKP